MTGWSYARIGQQSRAFHRTQGMGRWRVPRLRWLAAGVGFAGVLVDVNPGALWTWGVPALLLAVVAGPGDHRDPPPVGGAQRRSTRRAWRC